MTPHDIGREIARRRRELGLSQEALAGIAGIRQATVSSVERALHEPQLTTLAVLAAALRREARRRGVELPPLDLLV